jgi:hypothetical protein
MRLLLSNNKQVENSVNKDEMETWGNQQSAVQTGGEATPADRYRFSRNSVASAYSNHTVKDATSVASGLIGLTRANNNDIQGMYVKGIFLTPSTRITECLTSPTRYEQRHPQHSYANNRATL